MTARSIIRQHLVEHAEITGFAAPPLLIDYLSELCTVRLDNPDIAPEDSWTECYFRLTAAQMSWFGDSCLFYLGLQPQWHQRRGIARDFLPTLGSSAYAQAYDYSRDLRYQQLAHWFPYLQQFLESAVRPGQPLSLVMVNGLGDK
jgi:hypothetical protein